MRRSVRAIGQSRVGNPPVGARLRLRSASRAAIVASMVKRRVLLPSLVAMFVLLGAGQALAAPTWLAGESQDGAEAVTGVPADVATDSSGNSVAVWAANPASGGEVRAAFRPRGGPWGAPESLDGALSTLSAQPRVAVQPNGEFIAVWLANNDGTVLRSARRPAGGGWSAAATIGGAGCCGIGALLASADGTVTLIDNGDGFAASYTKEPGSDLFGEPERLTSGNVFAAASDGSVVAVRSGFLCSEANCVVAQRRPPGGPWGSDEPVANIAGGDVVNGLAVTANPDSSYTAVWAEVANPEGIAPPGRVLSSDRQAGDAGAWAASRVVADLPDDIPGCGGCVDVSTGASGTQLALWKQGGVMAAALRGGAGNAWGAPETAGEAPGQSQPYGAITAGGVPVAAWDSGFRAGVVTGTHREGGAWDPVQLVGGPARGGFPAGTSFLGDLAADGQGDALTAWRDDNGVQTAGFDAAAPRFDAFALPAGTVGSAPFSAAASDNWSGPASIGWFFGDGASAGGASVSHAYAAAGTYTATAQATDGVGNTSSLSGPVTVTEAPCATGGSGDADKDGIVDGCDTNNGAKRPKAFKTVNATVVSGEVFVKLPAGSSSSRAAAARKAPKGFKRLLGAETIPVGATLDTAHGRVKVRSAADTKAKKLQSGQFFRGRFTIRQSRIKKRSKKLITELRLTGSSFKKTCKAKASISAKKKKSKKRVRRLFGNAKGSFRTSGRNAAATVRGTRWSVQDRCDGTLVTVQRGRVEVRDKVKRKTVIVRTGHTYLARAR
jgi:PKD domain